MNKQSLTERFIPGLYDMDLPLSWKKRIPYVLSANVVMSLCFTLLFISRFAVERRFDSFAVALLVLITLFVAVIGTLLRRHFLAGSILSSAGLFLLCAAVVLALPINGQVDLFYRVMSFTLAMSVCNFLVALTKRQVGFFLAGSLTLWVISFFGVNRDVLAADTGRVLLIFFMGVLGYLLSGSIFMLVNRLAADILAEAVHEAAAACENYTKLSSLVSDAREGYEIGTAIDRSVDEAGQAVNSVQSLFGYLSGEAENLKERSATLRESGSFVNTRVDSMIQQLTAQSAAVTQASAAMTEISANLTNISGIAERRRASMQTIAGSVESQKGLLKALLSSVQDVRQSSESIAAAVKAVEDISAKTSLLAMNASIEAAHAGTAGKGFSVIAQEIRKLSEETNRNVALISDVIKTNDTTVRTVSESVSALSGKIEENTRDTVSSVTAIDEILRGVTEMDTGAREVMNAIKEIVQQTGATNSLVDEVARVIRSQSEDVSGISGFSESLSERVQALGGNLVSVRQAMERISDLEQKNIEIITRLNNGDRQEENIEEI